MNSKNRFAGVYPFFFIIAFFGLLLLPVRDLNLDPRTIDQSFYGRERLITAVTDFRVLIGDRVFPKVLVGKDHWLVFTAENSIDDYQNDIPLTKKKLSEIQRGLDAVTAHFEEQGITLLVVVAPNKNTIYPELVPPEIPVIGNESRLDQIIDYLKQHGRTGILDLRPALLAAKRERQVYYATDTHWNDYGVFVAYQQIIDALQPDYPELKAHLLSDYRLVPPEGGNLDLANNIGSSLLTEMKVQLTPNFVSDVSFKELSLDNGRTITFSFNPDPSLPKAIVYHDSFFFRMIPILSENFSRVIYIPHYTGGGIWNLSWVEEEKPDVVIVEFTERYIQDIPRLVKP
jgi:alginate O-acetyltransferase complex protein AlgJ